MSNLSMARSPSEPYRFVILALLACEALIVAIFAFGSGQSEITELTGLNSIALHLLAFGTAAALASTIWPPLPVALGVLSSAVFVEGGQIFLPERDASAIDVAIGAVGIAIGLALTWTLGLLLGRSLR
ncbi:hypothetical protein EMQ25_11590 [Arsenicitalea aurantiaca]|uniref:VanZ family protein n=1 Tax=Arsenicitalea aurantiaca TaxID=1783274 RepID=A0A433X7A6_9HYPH|nr:hypothetical protein [Arsenicitalea aurantiaca]RUT29977.1 hypothetical protein EMQ25_11590 [Arsenicitalea aurantiaca]